MPVDLTTMQVSFQPRQWFPHGFDQDYVRANIMWVYRPCEQDGKWLVGFFYPDGSWFTESTFDDSDKAAARVNWLNGGK